VIVMIVSELRVVVFEWRGFEKSDEDQDDNDVVVVVVVDWW